MSCRPTQGRRTPERMGTRRPWSPGNARFLFLLLSILHAAATSNTLPQSSQHVPNIVVYVMDDASPWSVYEQEVFRMLSASGATFSQAQTPSPVCTPSRYSMLTGQYAPRALIGPPKPLHMKASAGGYFMNIEFNTKIASEERTVARVLGEHGYSTHFVGKWHNFACQAPPDWNKIHPTQWESTLKEQYPQLQECVRHRSGFDTVSGLFFGNSDDTKFLPPPLRHHNPAWLVSEAISAGSSAKEPFLLWVADTMPHGDIMKPEYDCELHTPSGQTYSDMPPYYKNRSQAILAGGKLSKFEEGLPAHIDCKWVRRELSLDRATVEWPGLTFGSILDWLGERLADTLVVVTSDHGVMSKNHPYQDGVKVPLIMSWPRGGIQQGRHFPDLVSHIDLIPTLLDVYVGTRCTGRSER